MMSMGMRVVAGVVNMWAPWSLRKVVHIFIALEVVRKPSPFWQHYGLMKACRLLHTV
jgi:hypothetical protein